MKQNAVPDLLLAVAYRSVNKNIQIYWLFLGFLNFFSNVSLGDEKYSHFLRSFKYSSPSQRLWELTTLHSKACMESMSCKIAIRV